MWSPAKPAASPSISAPIRSKQDGQKITFLDTPGHEAFTAMRARGAQATDIAVLVVAADDSVMPQTIESIKHAKAAGVPIIVAINKIDTAGADPNKVRTALLQHEVFVESMGGDTLDVEVSASRRQGLDKLLEPIVLQAEMLELKANPDGRAEGSVIEAKLDRGRGAVATVLVQRGTLKVGDIVVAGSEWARVRALIDDKGEQVKTAGPSTPVEVLGFSGVPDAGDRFSVVETEARAREITEYRQRQLREKSAVGGVTSLEQMMSQLQTGVAAKFPLVIKADVQGRPKRSFRRSTSWEPTRSRPRSSCPASAASPNPTSRWPRPPRPSSSASMSAPTGRPASSPSAKASRSATTTSSTISSTM